jgi:pimeloyl-ACP methyl ester carboxylesterase
MKTQLFLIVLTVVGYAAFCQPKNIDIQDEAKDATPDVSIRFKTVTVDGLDIFYREGGDPANHTILFLHGFPSSSHMYRHILKELSSRYHVIAPDYPGFGLSSAPTVNQYAYTFDNISLTMDHFVDALKLKDISLYVQDYGGPVGFRMASRRPEMIRTLVIQNANAYTEGLGKEAAPLVNYFTDPNPETEKGARGILKSTQWQYTDGAGDLSKVSPDSYIMDDYYLSRAGNDEIQLALFRNYASNLKLYDSWHAYFRQKQPPTLVIWGKNDKIFISPGAAAYKKDLRDCEVHLLNGGHFVLEEHYADAAKLIDSFLSAKLKRK